MIWGVLDRTSFVVIAFFSLVLPDLIPLTVISLLSDDVSLIAMLPLHPLTHFYFSVFFSFLKEMYTEEKFFLYWNN